MKPSDSQKQNADTWWGHPKGLFFLIGTEVWERLSFYGLRFLLPLFLAKSTLESNPGWGWTRSMGGLLACCYGAAIYMAGILGGYVAQHYTGAKKAVLWGAAMQCAGHFSLGLFEGKKAFFCGLWLLVVGTSLLKPTISGLVGMLYPKKDPRKDQGFSYFYLGINLGALFAAIVLGWIGECYDYHTGFGLAGVGMLVSLGTFILGNKHIPDTKTPQAKQGSAAWLIKWFGVPLVATLGIATILLGYETIQHLGPENIVFGLRCLASLLALAMVSWLVYARSTAATQVEKDRWLLFGISLIGLSVFMVGFEQPSSFLSDYTKKRVNTTAKLWGFAVPAAWFQGINAACIILLTSSVVGIWAWLRRKYGGTISAAFKVGVGNLLMAVSFLFLVFAEWGASKQGPGVGVGAHWLIALYVFISVAELCIMPILLSLTTKLVPKNMVSTAMGLFFAAIGLSTYGASQVIAVLEDYAVTEEAKQAVVLHAAWVLVALSAVVGILFLLFNKRLTQLAHGAEDLVEEEKKVLAANKKPAPKTKTKSKEKSKPKAGSKRGPRKRS